jgi:hypothetical protein
MTSFVIGTLTPAPALTPNQVCLKDRVVMCFDCNSPGHFAHDYRLYYNLKTNEHTGSTQGVCEL